MSRLNNLCYIHDTLNHSLPLFVFMLLNNQQHAYLKDLGISYWQERSPKVDSVQQQPQSQEPKPPVKISCLQLDIVDSSVLKSDLEIFLVSSGLTLGENEQADATLSIDTDSEAFNFKIIDANLNLRLEGQGKSNLFHNLPECLGEN